MNKSIYIKIGFTVGFAIIALIWGINFLKGKGLFSDQSHYYAIYDRIDGLEVSNSVLINGFKVGQVSDIHFLPDTSGRLIVEFSMGNQYSLPKKTVAQIFSSDLMGTKSISLIYGDVKGIQNPGDTLISDFEGSLTEMVSVQMLPLKNKAEDLLKEMEKAISIVTYIFNEETRDNVMASLLDMKKTFHSLESSSSNLDSIVQGGKSKIDNILTNVESISRNLDENNEEITNLFKNLSNISDSLAKANIAQTITELNYTIAELNGIVNKINSGKGTMGMLVNNDSLYNNLEDVSYNLNRLLQDFRLNPKRYIHLSAFDLGKTVYVDSENSNKKNEKIVYKIQIASSNKSIPLIPDNFKGYKNIEESSVNGIYIYTYGSHKKIEKARTLLQEVKDDFPEAILLEITGGAYNKID